MREILRLKQVCKKYGREKAIQEIDLLFKAGLIYGIVGKNGSGKSTILNLLIGILKPDSGSILKNIHNREIGSSFGEHGFYPSFSVRKNIEIVRLIKNNTKSELQQAMQFFDLDKFGHKKYQTLSSGMKQRVSLTAAFLGNPQMIILDEPTNHLDIEGIFILRKLIEKRKNENVCFIITSHHLSELENICDHFYFVESGKTVSEGSKGYYIQNYQALESAYKKIIG